MYHCSVLADSLAPNGQRLTTLLITFPRIVLAELNTHRQKSRNSASSRAIPVEKMIRMVEENPFVPEYWGKNQKGMQAETELNALEQSAAGKVWLEARDKAVDQARKLLAIGVHKQLTNRLLEPFMWHTVIVSATDWRNFLALRTHKDAQPEIRRIAVMMQDVLATHQPESVPLGSWHLPLVDETERKTLDPEQLRMISAGRCARVSYLTHDGKRDPVADMALAQRLADSGHMSPFEHVATPCPSAEPVGNFTGWWQLRKSMPNEAVYVERETD
jgi:thymidylate synthase ThyX